MVKKIKELLDLIIKTTYPDIKIYPYYLKIENKKRKTRNGYWQKKEDEKFATIVIYNLERGTKEVLKTNIHEIAHNVEFSLFGETKHSKRFYLIYKRLLETAIKLGLLTFEEIKNLYDIQRLVEIHGPITPKYGSLKHLVENKTIIKVNQSYSVKDILKSRGYTYNRLEQNWIKEINSESVDQEINYLSTIVDKKNIEVNQIQDIKIGAMAYITVDNCYTYKDILKNNGYVYKGYGYKKGTKWVKKILIEDKEKELELLKNMKNVVVNIKLINPKRKRNRIQS